MPGSGDYFSAIVSTIAFSALMVVPQASRADDTSSAGTLAGVQQQLQNQQQQLDSAEQKLDEQLQEIKAQKEALQKQQQQIDALRTALTVAPVAGSQASGNRTVHSLKALFQVPRLSPEVAAEATIPVQAQAAPGTPSAPVGQPPAQQEERPEISDVSLASQGGVLTPRGMFSFEPSFQYQYTSNNQVLLNGLTIVPGITIGSATIRQLVDRMMTFTAGGRFGITNRLEVEAEVPWVRRSDSTSLQPLTANGSVTSLNTKGSDLGDVQFGAHYQINSGSGGWPYFVANVLVKTATGKSPFDVPVDFNSGIPTQLPTGTGFWAVQPSVTAIYPSDPVVFFANLRYLKNFGADVTIQPSALPGAVAVPTRAHVDPGDGIGGSFGMGFGINDQASFSLAYEQTYLLPTAENGISIPGSSFDIGSFDLGFSYQVTKRVSANLGIAIGATKAAPDTAITLRVPIKFQVYQ